MACVASVSAPLRARWVNASASAAAAAIAGNKRRRGSERQARQPSNACAAARPSVEMCNVGRIANENHVDHSGMRRCQASTACSRYASTATASSA
jgi:hypothetical protein